MSVAERPPSAAPRPPTLTPRRRGVWGTVRFIALLLILIAAHVYGWQVTRMRPFELVSGLPNARHIIAGLVQPDVIERVEEKVTVEVPFGLGCADRSPRVTRTTVGGEQVMLTVVPGCASVGEVVSVIGEGFPSDRRGQVFLANTIGYVRPGPTFDVGGDHSFATAFTAPSDVGDFFIRATVSWPVNQWQLSETLTLSARLMLETVFLALMGTTLAVVVTVPLSFLGAHNLMRGSRLGESVYFATRTLFNLLRSVEVLIIAVIMVVIVGIGPFAGVLAIVIHSIGALGKLYSEAIESIDHGPIEAITATGANPIQVVVFAVIPQIIPQFISFTMYRWDINVRMSTVIGLVGGGGIGYLLIQYINLLQWHQAATALWLIAIVVMAMDFASARFRARLV